MKKVRKFFDAAGKETEPKNAITCKELVLDKKGSVVEVNEYHVGEPQIKFKKGALEKLMQDKE